MPILTPNPGNPSSTRADLRRAIGRALSLGEPFFQDIQDGYSTATGGSTTTLVDTSLSYLWDGKEMRGSWLYVTSGVNAGKERRITSFVSATGTFTVAPPFGSAVSANDRYEVHWHTSARSKNDAIERALRSAYPAWFSSGYADLVICTDETEMTSALGLPTDIREALALWLEPSHPTEANFTATSGTTLTAVVSGATWTTDQWDGYRLSIYDGQGRGQWVLIDSNTATTLTFTQALGVAPASGSKFMLCNVNDDSDWWELDDWKVLRDGAYGTRLLLPTRLQGQEGKLVRLYYKSDVPLLADDDDETTVPRDWIIAEAVKRLLVESPLPSHETSVEYTAEQMETERRAQRDLLTYWTREAEGLRARLAWPRPPSTFRFPLSARRGAGSARWGNGRFFG